MAAVREVSTLYEKLKLEWVKSPQNLEICGQLLGRLKVTPVFILCHD